MSEPPPYGLRYRWGMQTWNGYRWVDDKEATLTSWIKREFSQGRYHPRDVEFVAGTTKDDQTAEGVA